MINYCVNTVLFIQSITNMYQHRQNYKYQCPTCPNHYGTNYKSDYTRHTMRLEHERFTGGEL